MRHIIKIQILLCLSFFVFISKSHSQRYCGSNLDIENIQQVDSRSA